MHEEEVVEYKDPMVKDIKYNWVDSSVFLFYLEVFCIIALLIGGSYGLYVHRYKGKPEVIIPANTQYTPEYK
ncbi:MAG TPA: hypothetical protein VK711_16815 [Puia sp.]|jgi:hypothetical protein|nr:hypothetical protein [Puia sp.]